MSRSKGLTKTPIVTVQRIILTTTGIKDLRIEKRY
jgi:hypothetical protein